MTSTFLRQTYHPAPSARLGAQEPAAMPWAITVAVIARDEERCIRRCVDSALASAADAVLVLDTGSTDRTAAILADYTDSRLSVVQHRWDHSFAAARNAAMDRARPGWIVFLDADEWLTDDTAAGLQACLHSFESVPGIELATLAPTIREAELDVLYDNIPRIMPTWTLRYHGAVHEYPRVPGSDVIPGLFGVSLEFGHDGYRPEVALAKGKRQRNLSLLERARADEPRNGRWLYFHLRDGLWEMSAADVIGICARLDEADQHGAGDRLGPDGYRRNALVLACTRLAQLGKWRQMSVYCDDLDRLCPYGSPDAVYFRGLRELLDGPGARTESLRTTMRTRRDARVMADSRLDPDGRALDALIGAYLHELKGQATADTYLAMCDPWIDPFFDASRLCRYGRRVQVRA
jgi:hypothetical protein